jgi:hypothetical protein
VFKTTIKYGSQAWIFSAEDAETFIGSAHGAYGAMEWHYETQLKVTLLELGKEYNRLD